MAKKTKKVEMVDPIVEQKTVPVTSDVSDPVVPLRAVAEKCLPGMRTTWWKGIEAFSKLHSLDPENSTLSQCLALLHAWGGKKIQLKPYM
jgi:hypothetical protein